MNVEVNFKQLEGDDTLKEYCQKRSEKFTKYFNGNVDVIWTLSMVRHEHIVHCHVTGKNMDYFIEEKNNDFYQSIDRATDKMDRKLRQHKEQVKNHLHHH